MSQAPLKPVELEMVSRVFRRHPEVVSATLFGTRVKGTHSKRSDVDLAIAGNLEQLDAEAIKESHEGLFHQPTVLRRAQ